jgi:hypothetical protein
MKAFERERSAERAACDLAIEEKDAEWEARTDGKYSAPKTKTKVSSTTGENGEENIELSPFAKELYELRVKMRSKEEAWSSALRNTEELLDMETEKLRQCEEECSHLV